MNLIEENRVVPTGKLIFPAFSYCGSRGEKVIQNLVRFRSSQNVADGCLSRERRLVMLNLRGAKFDLVLDREFVISKLDKRSTVSDVSPFLLLVVGEDDWQRGSS